MRRSPEHQAAHELLHKLWTQYVGTKGYNKQDWLDLERAIEKLAGAQR